MLERTTNRGRLLEAALKLAERRPWDEVSLYDIAREAGLTLLDMKQCFASKDAMVTALSEAVDEEVLRRIQVQDEVGEGARDRLFGVIMTRFDVLQPYRAALRSIHAAGRRPPSIALCGRVLDSQRWMLAGAGIETDGALGFVRMAGLAGVYARVFGVWLEDEDPGLAKTMAALDKGLRRGERPLETIDEICGSLGRMADRLSGRSARQGKGAAPTVEPMTGGADSDRQPEAS